MTATKILLVDDESIILDILKIDLEQRIRDRLS